MRYKTSNWPEYNKSLINRGSLTFWFSEDVIKGWINVSTSYSRESGEIYADARILCSMVLKSVYHLTYQSLQGFTKTLIELLGLNLPVPSYTQTCRRAAKLKLPKLSKRRVTDVVVDASGLKIFSPWKKDFLCPLSLL